MLKMQQVPYFIIIRSSSSSTSSSSIVGGGVLCVCVSFEIDARLIK